ncbi:FecR family protein [Flavobacterium piscinae]|uniref:FecR family protein n=1 Tax=Flavobacterium piscinae TaxID=2506424 RepID=A0A4Q1KJ92_9FLAO|nr:FecR family protein [Flavobacterium piscinae]RXR29425.1 FecR family protein [Flavobacterium piscinae]
MEENYTLAKWLNNELEGEELKAFEASEDFAVYQKIKQYSGELTTPAFDDDKMLQTILQRKKNKTISIQKVLLRIAAVFILGFGITFAVKNFTNFTEFSENGATTAFVLPDDSSVLLNAGSSVEYKKWNWNNERKLKLDGEAYFKVAKGKKFEVATALGTVSVLGTQFNVKNRATRLDVTCYEGKVQVNYQNQQVILTKGMMISFENGTQIYAGETKSLEPEWLKKEVNFSKENLQAILDEINRQYNVVVEYKGKPTNQDFSGTIPMNDLAVALEIIATTYHLQIIKSNDSTYTLQ